MMNHHLPAGPPHMNPPGIPAHQQQNHQQQQQQQQQHQHHNPHQHHQSQLQQHQHQHHQHQHQHSLPHQHQQHHNPHQQSRRQQDYHNQFHPQIQQVPHSPAPLHHHPYAAYVPPPYFSHPGPHMNMAYPPPRWQPQPYAPPFAMHAQPHYPPRSPMSPMVVSSQPQPLPQQQQQQQQQQLPPPPPMAPMTPMTPMTPITQQASILYKPPPSHSPAPAPITPITPLSAHPHALPSPPRPDSVQSSNPPAPPRRPSTTTSQTSTPAISRRQPFYPDLPWYSVPRDTFPAKAARRRRKKRQDLVETNDSVALPSREAAPTAHADAADVAQSEASTIPSSLDKDTPATSQTPSETEAPSAVEPLAHANHHTEKTVLAEQSTSPQTNGRRNTRTAVPIVPVVPTLPLSRPKPASSDAATAAAQRTASPAASAATAPPAPPTEAATDSKPAEALPVASPPSKAAPKSWADLVRSKNAAAASASAALNGIVTTNGTNASRSGSLADALKQYDVDNDENISFLEPRGLVNTGNMCYMNSILQILVFCTPFYNFLEQVGKRAAHSFKSDTPLVDAMIMFMREFKPIDNAESAEKLRMRLKQEELEQYGSPITPEYVYDVIKRLPRFSSMRRGHQQDAEEFLGFLLAGMHDECVTVMRSQPSTSTDQQLTSPTSPTENGWLEVGPKQKAAITRQAGDLATSPPTPITRIFGGQLRSELRVAGLKNSVTLEPYQPLQLDIGGPQISNITDALRNLTKPETLTGDFGGRESKATKQVFIESLPPVLILHLKRFQYDNAGGTQKIWKRVGYPLHLEIPKEVFAPQKRGVLGIKGEPIYRLTGVVYHHGKSAAGGHYTVDILRQDEREWVRVDDTMIRRIRAEDVAEGGSEEDPKVLARALEQHQKDDSSAKRNLFEGLDGDDDVESLRSWNEVDGSGGAAKKWAEKVKEKDSNSGKSTPSRRRDEGGVRDNKVAYILLYERVSKG